MLSEDSIDAVQEFDNLTSEFLQTSKMGRGGVSLKIYKVFEGGGGGSHNNFIRTERGLENNFSFSSVLPLSVLNDRSLSYEYIVHAC